MQLIDTHSHIFLEQFDEDRDEAIKRAIETGIGKILLPNVDLTTIERLYNTVDTYPDICIPMMGLHPTSVKDDYKTQLKEIEKLLTKGSYCAIGEIGIDLYWDKTHFKEQKEAFEYQAEMAKETGLPIVIHVRDSFDETFELIDKLNSPQLTGVFHCFTGTFEQAKKIIDYGFKLGIGGVVTFKNAGLDKVIQNIDLNHLVLETDAPYLAPTPYRGKRNETAYLKIIAEKVAEIKACSLTKVADITTKNAIELFKIQAF